MKNYQIAQKVGITPAFYSEIINGKKRPGRETAVRLEQITGVPFKTWMLGTPEEIRAELEAALAGSDQAGAA